MPSLKEKLISFVFYSHMGRRSFKILDRGQIHFRKKFGVLLLSSSLLCTRYSIGYRRLILLHRVDPTCVTEEKAETPLEIAEERRHTDIVALLLEATGEELPDNVKIQRLSEAMYKEDVEEAKKEFSKLLGSLSPELVS